MKLEGTIDKNMPEDLKVFKRSICRVRVQIIQLQDMLAHVKSAARNTADAMTSKMYNGLDEVLTAIGDPKANATPPSLSSMAMMPSFSSLTRSRSGETETKSDDVVTDDGRKDTLDLKVYAKIDEIEGTLQDNTAVVQSSLKQVMSLLQLKNKIDKSLKFPDLRGATNALKNIADGLKASAMGELNKLAEDLKLGGSANGLMEAGADGLLDEVCWLISDSMAEKRSKAESWRVREMATLCLKMLAGTVAGSLAEEIQGALVQRRVFETNPNVLKLIDAGSDLPTRLAGFVAMPVEEAIVTSAAAEELSEVAGNGLSASGGKGTNEKEASDGAEQPSSNTNTTDTEQPAGASVAKVLKSEQVMATQDDEHDLGASRCAALLEKDAIAQDLARPMEALAALEEEAQNESDGLKTSTLLVKCRMESNMLKIHAQNSSDMASKVRALYYYFYR